MKLLPQPQHVNFYDEKFYTDYNTVIMIDKNCKENVFLYAKMLQETIREWCGVETDIQKGDYRDGDIQLKEDATLDKGHYVLSIKENGIFIIGSTEEALLNGVQTLRQMYSQSGSVLPTMEIKDYPEIQNRGFFHDVSRGRVPHLSELKKLVDTMCYYKLNQLQLYVEHTYLFRDFSEVYRDETPLTAEEILELDGYCKERHIDLVPSLSTFGHLYMMLRTYTFADYCELTDVTYQPYSFFHRMCHHTVNVSNKNTLPLIKSMMKEYMSLFSSSYFNLCADETFDLCKGKSAHLTNEREVKEIYIEFLNELCSFVMENGKTPMFWGDILCGFPEKIKNLPKEGICLNWGYAALQSERETKILAEAGATQYTCPGVGGWNQWVTLFQNAYNNITRMCTYAKKYNAIGVLNTDWGDYGHINQPEFSISGLIFGASFSWNTNLLEFEDIAQRISLLAFCDHSGEFVSHLAKVEGKDAFKWMDIVQYFEMEKLGVTQEKRQKKFFETPVIPFEEANLPLFQLRKQLQQLISNMDSSTRYLHQKYLLGIDAIIIWNKVKPALAKKIYGFGEDTQDLMLVAVELESWFMKYKKEWRKVSKEGNLNRIADIVFWYADQLRK